MSRGANIPSSESRVADEGQSAPATLWRGGLPWFAALIPRKAMGSWSVEWEDDSEPEGWVARRMADAFARMEAAAQPASVALDAIRAAARDGWSSVETITAQAAALTGARVNRWRAPESPIASLAALVATRPVHGPPLLPA